VPGGAVYFDAGIEIAELSHRGEPVPVRDNGAVDFVERPGHEHCPGGLRIPLITTLFEHRVGSGVVSTRPRPSGGTARVVLEPIEQRTEELRVVRERLPDERRFRKLRNLCPIGCRRRFADPTPSAQPVKVADSS
jgi:hypothetical protein